LHYLSYVFLKKLDTRPCSQKHFWLWALLSYSYAILTNQLTVYTRYWIQCSNWLGYFYGTSIKDIQSNLPMLSPLFSSHLYLKVAFSYSVRGNFIWIQTLLRGHLSYKTTFSLSQRWPLNTGLTVLEILCQKGLFECVQKLYSKNFMLKMPVQYIIYKFILLPDMVMYTDLIFYFHILRIFSTVDRHFYSHLSKLWIYEI
jgi:hypothetical protein